MDDTAALTDAVEAHRTRLRSAACRVAGSPGAPVPDPDRFVAALDDPARHVSMGPGDR